jgi:dimethylhistidine N-methyltransferase
MPSHVLARVENAEFAEAVRGGLLANGQKTLPCRYFYDDVGTALFEAISRLPEYGLTRADERIIRAHAQDVVDALHGPWSVVELGSGGGNKTRWILEALARKQAVVYYPVDVSPAALAACRKELSELATVEPIESTYLQGLCEAVGRRTGGERLLVLFLGSTIGNFTRSEAARFLHEVRGGMAPGDALLLGTDLEKSEQDLLLAYDDPAGVTAAFNRNLLARINRELGADFVLERYAHEARYNRVERRVEMHLRSLVAHTVQVTAARVTVTLGAGETIWTESSHKFRSAEARGMLATAGFRCLAQWEDHDWPFAETLCLADSRAIRRDARA